MKFYIKPQLLYFLCDFVDSCILLKFYIKPQLIFIDLIFWCVVSYWNSTSNHNLCGWFNESLMLYLIEILHQTTTYSYVVFSLFSCILLKFYIKPQRIVDKFAGFFVVSYWNSTSNHNRLIMFNCFNVLYLIEILHQTTTLFDDGLSTFRICI